MSGHEVDAVIQGVEADKRRDVEKQEEDEGCNALEVALTDDSGREAADHMASAEVDKVDGEEGEAEGGDRGDKLSGAEA